MPRYQLVISNRFRRDLRRLDAQMHRRVLEVLEQLQENPRQGTELTDVKIGAWRLRVGDYRIRYDIEIVQTQMTKRGGFAFWPGGHHIADFHLAIGDDDTIDEQFNQLSALGKR